MPSEILLFFLLSAVYHVRGSVLVCNIFAELTSKMHMTSWKCVGGGFEGEPDFKGLNMQAAHFYISASFTLKKSIIHICHWHLVPDAHESRIFPLTATPPLPPTTSKTQKIVTNNFDHDTVIYHATFLNNLTFSGYLRYTWGFFRAPTTLMVARFNIHDNCTGIFIYLIR